MEKPILIYVVIEVTCNTHKPYIYPHRDYQKAVETRDSLQKRYPDDTFYINVEQV